MSPFVVTAKRQPPPGKALLNEPEWEVLSRRSVATLDEARKEAERITVEHGGTEGQALWARLGVGEGIAAETVGPLPDGTVIEVEQTTWHDLTHRTSHVRRFWLPADQGDGEAQQRILDAFNEARS